MALRLLVSAEGDPQERTFRYDFDGDRAQILLGRRGGVDVLLPHPTVSLVHARIERRGAGYQLVDDHATNGTWLNGVRLEPGGARPLERGDTIVIGEFVVALSEVEGEEPFAGDSSISIARKMVAEVLGVLEPGGEHPSLLGPSGERLAVVEPGRRYLIGSAVACDLQLADPSVAERHVQIKRDYRGVAALDLGSHTGLYVNDQFAAAERLLRDGDVLTVGNYRLRFADPAEVYLRRLEELPAPPREEPERRVSVAMAAVSTRRRGDLAVVLVASAIALLAAGGLIWIAL